MRTPRVRLFVNVVIYMYQYSTMADIVQGRNPKISFQHDDHLARQVQT